MRFRNVLTIAALTGALAFTAVAQETVRENRGGKIEWSTDLEAGMREARAANRPLMLYFTHDS